MGDQTLIVQLTLAMTPAAADELLAQVRDHADRDTTDGDRDAGLLMLPAEVVTGVVVCGPESRPVTWSRFGHH